MLDKSRGLTADCVTYDLEDSVSTHMKAEARQALRSILALPRSAGIKEQAVRINAVGSGLAEDDLAELVGIHYQPPTRCNTLLKTSTVQSTASRYHCRPKGKLGIGSPLGHRFPRTPPALTEKQSFTLGPSPDHHTRTDRIRKSPLGSQLHLQRLASALRARLRRRRLCFRPLPYAHPLTNRGPLRPRRNRHRRTRPRPPLPHRSRMHLIPGRPRPHDDGGGVPRR